MSETELALKSGLAKYLDGDPLILELGYGGKSCHPRAITFDMPTPYTGVGSDPQILRGDCRNLSFICNNAFDIIWSSHVLEDFHWNDLPVIVKEWRRVLKPGGLFITVCPDEQVYRNHCHKTGHPYNENHVNHDFSLETFKQRVAYTTGDWELVHENPLVDTYSWHLVLKKI